ncbi:MAG: rod shape-determining protein MreD [Albidovulum sp.]
MIDPISASRVGYRGLFVLLSLVIIFAQILPLNTIPAQFPGPDFLLCITLVWVQRRPDYVPALIVALVFVLEDLLTMRPPGLWPLIVLIGTEFLRRREATLRDMPFVLDWIMTSGVIIAMVAANWLILFVFIVPNAGIGPVILQALATMVAYPIVVLITLFAIGVRRVAKGEVDALGHRL